MSVRVGSSTFILGPVNPLGASRAGPPREDSTIPRKTTARGLPESSALAAPPSASCAECLDNWMECFAATVLPGSLSSDFKRGGERMLAPGREREAQEVKYESGAPLPSPKALPRPDQDHWLASPGAVGRWNEPQAPERRTEQRVEAAKWCQRFGGANLVRSGPGDSLGSGRGQGPGQHFENTKIAKIPPQRWVHLLLFPFYR